MLFCWRSKRNGSNIYCWSWSNVELIFVDFSCSFLDGKSTSRPKVLFARVGRHDADKDLSYMIKYLFNFGFYKFGVETTLVMIVILISARLDIVAILYTGWLCLLFSVSRMTKARIWPIFQWFIVVLILIQYVLVVNLPPFLCFSKSNKKFQLVCKTEQ